MHNHSDEMPQDDWTGCVVVLMKEGEIANMKKREKREGEREERAMLQGVHPPSKRADRDVSSSRRTLLIFFGKAKKIKRLPACPPIQSVQWL